MSVFSSFGSLSLDDRKIIVGIDFGTTFSGLAWAERRRVDHISVIDSWPSSLTSAEGASDAKVPTALRYTGKGIEWGFQIPPLVERHEWFKLRLMGGSPRIAIPSGPSRTSEQLTTDYLTVLIKHLKYTLEQKLGSGILRSVPLEFVLTVPAIWSEVAKQKTLNACQKAGLDTKTSVTLVSEPEAAAIYTLHSLDPHGLEIGDSFVLCDAGGGTVDLISYTITGLYPRLQVKEAAEGTGGYCGSTYLDENFSKYLTGKLSKDPDWDSEVLAEAMAQFNTIKRQYLPSSSTAEGYSISVPGLANNERLGIRRNRMKIKATEMEGIFEPVIKDVIALVKGQIKATNKKIRAVLLVGGFGQNNYLKERLRSTLGSSIEVRQPPHAWTAVVRGAVMMGLASQNAQSAVVQLTSRVARKHYGIRMIVPYEKGKHSWSERY
jgi:molecular chaperone DnaK (HSP70)